VLKLFSTEDSYIEDEDRVDECWLKIVELRDGMRRVNVEGMILDKGEPRTVNLRAG